MDRLNAFELEVLENLPVEPIGLSLSELADGLLDNRGPAARGKVRTALEGIAAASVRSTKVNPRCRSDEPLWK